MPLLNTNTPNDDLGLAAITRQTYDARMPAFFFQGFTGT